MRFGLMAMQMNALIPAGLSPQQMMGYVQSFDHAALVRSLHGYGFNPIELGGDLAMFMPHAYGPAAIDALAALEAETGVTYTVHLPLWSVEPSTPLTPVREGSVQSAIDIIRATQPLEPETYVFHATGALATEFSRMTLPEQGRAILLRQFQAGALQSLGSILAVTGIPSRRLAIETIEFPFDLTLEMAEKLDLSLCLDTGHVLVGFSGEIAFFDALERCLPRLAEVHLHDAPAYRPDAPLGYGKDHAPLGAGDLDVAGLLDRLAAAQFRGPLVFELKVEQALASLQVVRALRPELVE